MKFGCKNNYLESNEGTLAKGKISQGNKPCIPKPSSAK